MKDPTHIAIIMDGNGRWAKKNLKKDIFGHTTGVKTLNPIINFCIRSNIKVLTLYALSLDNFNKRKKSEIKNIFNILHDYMNNNLSDFIKNKIFLNFIGELERIPRDTRNLISLVKKKTKLKNNSLVINIAFNYSSRLEILNACKIIKKKNEKISINNFSKYLYTSPYNDPDILIRTGCFQRLSDFLLWQNSYTEFFFLKKMWPDFKVSDLKKIIFKYKKIKRNFGS